jgi:hypothetical protein
VSEGGKLFSAIKETADASGMFDNLRKLIPKVRSTRNPGVYVAHHRSHPHDFDNWQHINMFQKAHAKVAILIESLAGSPVFVTANQRTAIALADLPVCRSGFRLCPVNDVEWVTVASQQLSKKWPSRYEPRKPDGMVSSAAAEVCGVTAGRARHATACAKNRIGPGRSRGLGRSLDKFEDPGTSAYQVGSAISIKVPCLSLRPKNTLPKLSRQVDAPNYGAGHMS